MKQKEKIWKNKNLCPPAMAHTYTATHTHEKKIDERDEKKRMEKKIMI